VSGADLRTLVRALEAFDRNIEPVVHSGNAVEVIVDCDERLAVDHIVVANHCQTGLRPLVRNVPESIFRNARRPVTDGRCVAGRTRDYRYISRKGA
jgi:nucleotide-binding universal stress UspA family protein